MVQLILSWILGYLTVGAIIATIQFIRQYRFNMLVIKFNDIQNGRLELVKWWFRLCTTWIWLIWKGEEV